MRGELEPYEQSPAEMETEFGSYPEEVRQAALEYARGLVLDAGQPSEPLADGDVPDFIIVGHHGGTVLASTALTCSKFLRRIAGYDRVPIGPGPHAPVARVPRYSIVIGVELTGFEQVVAESYPVAMAELTGSGESS